MPATPEAIAKFVQFCQQYLKGDERGRSTGVSRSLFRAFAFMELEQRPPVFRNNQVEVAERATRRMGELLVELKKRGIDGLVAQRFVLRCVLAMFAEDRGLLPNSLFISCVQDCLSGQSSYKVLGACSAK